MIQPKGSYHQSYEFPGGTGSGFGREAALLPPMTDEYNNQEERENFQALVLCHREGIYRLAYHLTGNREEAEDLVQDSLLEAFRGFRYFRLGTRFDRWMNRILTRNYIDSFRKRKREPVVALEDYRSGGEGEIEGTVAPASVREEESWSEPVALALESLTPEYRSVVTLCDIQGLSYEEAGKVLRCPVGTVRSRLHRARDLLRRRLGPLRPGRGGN
jgi:RNA polymerase sigma factor (sigma-70 family)